MPSSWKDESRQGGTGTYLTSNVQARHSHPRLTHNPTSGRHANAKQNFLYGDFAPALKLEGAWAADLSHLKSELKKLTEERDKIIVRFE